LRPYQVNEATSTVVDGPHSVIDEPENHLQARKAVMALVSGGVATPGPRLARPSDEFSDILRSHSGYDTTSSTRCP
jgi:hypothetical protein